MNFCGFFKSKTKKGQLATETFQKLPIFTSEKQIPLTCQIDHMSKIAAIQSQSQDLKFVEMKQGQNNLLVRTVRKSNYQELVPQLKQNKKKFFDQEFPPRLSSLGDFYKDANISWKRIPQIIQNPVFIQKGISPYDLMQGGTNDCYFLGALVSLAQKPYRIARCLNSTKISSDGIYMVRFLFQGVLTEVVVDDYIPMNGKIPAFAQKVGNQIWPMIFEKCWAKLMKSYSNVNYGGYPHQSFYALTGAPTYSYVFNVQLWDKIVQAKFKDYPIQIGTLSDKKKNQPVGIVSSHAYTVLQLFQIKGYKLLRLRNPWGMFQWKGRASDSDTEFWSQFTKQQKIIMKYEIKNDGIFYMVWEDCPTYFDMFQICELKDNASLISLRSNFNVKRAQLFELQTLGGEIAISLVEDYIFNGQKGNNKQMDIKYISQSFILVARYNGSNKKGYQFQYVDSIFKQLPFYANTLKLNLQKGKYIIYTKCFWNYDQSKQATVSIYTESNVRLRAVDQSLYPQVLQKAYLFVARSHPEYSAGLDKGSLVVYTTKELEKGGHGYLAVKLGSQATSKVMLEFDEKQFTEKSLSLKKPYKGQKNIRVIISPGQQHIILFRCKLINFPKNISVPIPKITKLK